MTQRLTLFFVACERIQTVVRPVRALATVPTCCACAIQRCELRSDAGGTSCKVMIKIDDLEGN
jgi:hypothetical protein